MCFVSRSFLLLTKFRRVSSSVTESSIYPLATTMSEGLKLLDYAVPPLLLNLNIIYSVGHSLQTPKSHLFPLGWRRGFTPTWNNGANVTYIKELSQHLPRNNQRISQHNRTQAEIRSEAIPECEKRSLRTQVWGTMKSGKWPTRPFHWLSN